MVLVYILALVGLIAIIYGAITFEAFFHYKGQ